MLHPILAALLNSYSDMLYNANACESWEIAAGNIALLIISNILFLQLKICGGVLMQWWD